MAKTTKTKSAGEEKTDETTKERLGLWRKRPKRRLSLRQSPPTRVGGLIVVCKSDFRPVDSFHPIEAECSRRVGRARLFSSAALCSVRSYSSYSILACYLQRNHSHDTS